MTVLLVGFFGSFLISLFLIPLIKKFSLKNSIVALPSLRKVHSDPIPLLGGVGIYLSFLIMSLLLLEWDLQLKGFFLGATIMVIIGVLDDILDVDARTKLAGQIIAGSIVIFSGVKISFITNMLESQGVTDLGILSLPLTLLWIVGLTNTMNIIDGLDGLCAGIAVIASFTLLSVQLLQNNFQVTAAIQPSLLVLLTLSGASLGFLKYNFFPAGIFMGDSGSLFLGFSLSVLSIMGSLKGATLVTLVIPIFALGFPVFDTLFAILRRRWWGKPIFEADKEHIHHQLLNAGLSHKRVVLILYFLSACFGLTAILLSSLAARLALGVLMALSLSLLLFMGMMVFKSRKKSE